MTMRPAPPACPSASATRHGRRPSAAASPPRSSRSTVPAFTIKNLMDLDDLAAGRGVEIQARFARSHIDSEHLGVSHFRYGPGVRSPVGHRHEVQEEVYVVLTGSGRMRFEEEIVEVRQWDAIRVAPEVVRGIEAGPDGLELLVVGSDRPPDGDGVTVADWWTD